MFSSSDEEDWAWLGQSSSGAAALSLRIGVRSR